MVHVTVVTILLFKKKACCACNCLLFPSWCRGHCGGALSDGHLEGVDCYLGNKWPAGETNEAGSQFSVSVLMESYILGPFSFLLKEEGKSYSFQ